MLQFLGRGAAFTAHHNCALFESDGGAVLLDCPMSAFQRLIAVIPQKKWAQITVLVTHTHGDHIGGIPMLIHFAKYLHLPVRVIVPTAEMADDLRFLIERLDGCDPAAYTLDTAETCGLPWLSAAVPVQHAETLRGRCFGYVLTVGGETIVYTGDTAELAPFLPYLHAGAYLYTEASNFDSGVHLYIDALLPELRRLTAEGVRVFLMHMDAEDAIAAKIRGTGIEFAPLLVENA